MNFFDLPYDILEIIYQYKHRLEMKPVLQELTVYHNTQRLDKMIQNIIHSLMLMEFRRIMVNREILELLATPL